MIDWEMEVHPFLSRKWVVSGQCEECGKFFEVVITDIEKLLHTTGAEIAEDEARRLNWLSDNETKLLCHDCRDLE